MNWEASDESCPPHARDKGKEDMTRPDFAEMARVWLQRTTSITSASPETETAIAEEFARVWQLGVLHAVLVNTTDARVSAVNAERRSRSASAMPDETPQDPLAWLEWMVTAYGLPVMVAARDELRERRSASAPVDQELARLRAGMRQIAHCRSPNPCHTCMAIARGTVEPVSSNPQPDARGVYSVGELASLLPSDHAREQLLRRIEIERATATLARPTNAPRDEASLNLMRVREVLGAKDGETVEQAAKRVTGSAQTEACVSCKGEGFVDAEDHGYFTRCHVCDGVKRAEPSSCADGTDADEPSDRGFVCSHQAALDALHACSKGCGATYALSHDVAVHERRCPGAGFSCGSAPSKSVAREKP